MIFKNYQAKGKSFTPIAIASGICLFGSIGVGAYIHHADNAAISAPMPTASSETAPMPTAWSETAPMQFGYLSDSEYDEIKANAQRLNDAVLEVRSINLYDVKNQGQIPNTPEESKTFLANLAQSDLGLSAADAQKWADTRVNSYLDLGPKEQGEPVETAIEQRLSDIWYTNPNATKEDWIEILSKGIAEVYGVSAEGAAILAHVHLALESDDFIITN